jgi:glycosyltransferase involved in cell wall biosynthesis
MHNELISVILPVYNAEKYLSKSIRSLLDQTYDNLEIIIIDDGSEDSSPSIIKTFKDERIRYFENTHKGLTSELNFGLQAASGNYIARMDADDTCNLNRLTVQMDFLKNNPDIQLVSTNYNHIDENDKILLHKVMPEHNEDIEYMMPVLNSVCHAGMLTYKSALIEAGAYRENFSFVEDQDLFLRMISRGMKMYNIQEFLYSYRYNKKRLSKQNISTILKNRYNLGSEYLKKYYIDHPADPFHFNFRYGLIEYYSGDISSARKYFLKALKLKGMKDNSLYRYLIPSLFGDTIIKFLRNQNILSGLSSILNKSGKDYHMILKNE